MSYGDKNLHLSLWEPQSPDFFTREIDQAVLNGSADVALHSAKDLSVPIAEELEIYALTEGGDPSDALVSQSGLGLSQLPAGARIGTSSPSRRDQLRILRPDIEFVPIRGTIEKRLGYIDDGRADAIVVARIALDRLGLQHRITEILSIETHPLQGKLAVVGPRGSSRLRSIFKPINIRRNWGSVILAGAGPGNPELVTLQVQRAIEQADIIFYDALVNPEILQNTCGELVYVGKRRAAHSHPQHEINQLLAEAAMQGKSVLRLKGGDPMIFGRVSEEIEYLQSRLIDIQIFPGITAASAAAAFSGIPLTERGNAASLSFYSAYPASHIQVPPEGTAVYYMSSHNLHEIIQLWAEHYPDPVDRKEIGFALIHNASQVNQHTWKYSLDELNGLLAQQVDAPTFPAPLLVIAGRTIRPADHCSWWECLPSVWHTGTQTPKIAFAQKKRYQQIPLIEIAEPENPPDVSEQLSRLETGSWIIFTSRHGVRWFFTHLHRCNLDTRALSGFRIAAVGKVTASELTQHGIHADLVPEVESSTGLVEAFRRMNASPVKIWIPSSNLYLASLKKGMEELGHQVTRTIVYTNRPKNPDHITSTDMDWPWNEIHFTSPSTVHQFFRLFPKGPPESIQLSAIGTATWQALQEQIDAQI